MSKDKFFTATNCDRCAGTLEVRKTSWFTEETICGNCIKKETMLKHAMALNGKDYSKYEGCGYIPNEKGELT